MTVFDLKKGDRAVVDGVNIYGSAAARLNSLGLKKGAKVELLGYSLFKSSALLGVGGGGVRIALRKSIAEKIEVKR